MNEDQLDEQLIILNVILDAPNTTSKLELLSCPVLFLLFLVLFWHIRACASHCPLVHHVVAAALHLADELDALLVEELELVFRGELQLQTTQVGLAAECQVHESCIHELW